MSAELILSASAFTHKGQLYDENTSNFILDGRYLFGYELDNSHVSISSKDKNYFFAICDSRPNEFLNSSVSGVKELKKLSGKLKTSTNDIKTKTEMMAECFINTENLLYESMGYSDVAREQPTHTKPLASLDKKLVSYPDGKPDVKRPGLDGIDGEENGVSEYEDYEDDMLPDYDAYDDVEDSYNYRDEDRYEDDLYDDYEDGYGYDDEENRLPPDEPMYPGGKGFSTAGIIISDKKVSVLAQGDCEAFLLRGASLRILSSEVKQPGGASQGHAGANGRQRQGAMAQPYYGRSSEVFDPKVGDVLLLCSRSIVDALGRENVDDYLALREDASIISSTIIHDAARNEPDDNLTCLVVRVDDIIEEDMLQSLQRRVDTRGNQSVRGTSGHQFNSGMNGGMAQNHVGGVAAGADVNAGYDAGAARGARAPYQSRDASFSKPATSKFEVPSKKFGSKNINKSMIQSIVTTIILIVLLFVSYTLFEMNREGNNSNQQSAGATATPSATATPGSNNGTTTAPSGGGGGDDRSTDDEGRDPSFTTDGGDDTTTTTTTEPTTTTAPGPLAEHRVVQGDMLGRIAAHYYGSSRSTYVDLIKEANNLTTDNIRVGTTLIIPRVPDHMTSTTTSN